MTFPSPRYCLVPSIVVNYKVTFMMDNTVNLNYTLIEPKLAFQSPDMARRKNAEFMMASGNFNSQTGPLSYPSISLLRLSRHG
jgi:hypothetical protein